MIAERTPAMLPLADVLPLVSALFRVSAALLAQAQAANVTEQATLADLTARVNVTAAALASSHPMTQGINRGTTSQGGVGEVTHIVHP
jgi:hypothetical protein